MHDGDPFPGNVQAWQNYINFLHRSVPPKRGKQNIETANLNADAPSCERSNEPCFFTLAWRLRGRLRRATVCVNVGYARLRGIHLPTRNASGIAQGPFSFIYGAAEVDEEELDQPVLDEEGWTRRLCVRDTNRKGSF